MFLGDNDSTFGDIKNAIAYLGFNYETDANVKGGFNVDTKSAAQARNMMLIFSPEIVGSILFMSTQSGFGPKMGTKAILEAQKKIIESIGKATKSADNVYKTTLAGGKHSGFLKNFIERNPNEIIKSIKSMQSGNQGINIHLDKIANPTKYVSNWNTLRPSHQQSLITGWQNTVTKHTEQIQILQTILSKK